MRLKSFVLLILVLLTTSASAGRLTSFSWTNRPEWPVGTTLELCGNGNVCATGLTGTQHTLDLAVVPGDVIQGQIRAIPPNGYQCGSPPQTCQPSDWMPVALTWPENPTGVEATKDFEP